MFDIKAKAKALEVEDDGKVVHLLDENGELSYQDDGSDVVNAKHALQDALASAPADEAAVVALRAAVTDAENARKPVTWTICGINSKQYRKAEAWQRKVFRSLRNRVMTAEEEVQHQAEFTARCSLGFDGLSFDGKPFPFSTENATTALVNLPFVGRQLSLEMGDHAGFLKATSTSSPR